MELQEMSKNVIS